MGTNEDRIAELIAEFDTNRNVKSISTRLAEYGREAVEQLVPVLIAGESELCRTRMSWVFEHFGAEAVEPLIAGLRGEPGRKAAQRLRFAIAALEVADRSMFLPYFTDPLAVVREAALGAFEDRAAEVVPWADAILVMMADPDEDVRIGAYNALGSAGRELIPFLMRARRSAPPLVRRELREMLLELVGLPGMDARDQAAIVRFLRIKAQGEGQPEPMHLCGTWLAFPTSDQDAVLEALDLSDPITVPMGLGADVWNHDHHGWYGHNSCRRMYVTPALNGWTLAFGDPPEQGHAGQTAEIVAAMQAQLARLSTVFGEAHSYGESCGDGWTSWCIARDGEIVRYYDAFESDDEIGEEPPEEGSYAVEVAAALSVNPAELGPDTEVRGRAVVALTSCGRELGMQAGAFKL
ncbi:MAG: HEAT repeat domain-containing protein [Catenulispora sp.]|nr:HEAT repeat domain-containing protein [Catenulispora sp.]